MRGIAASCLLLAAAAGGLVFWYGRDLPSTARLTIPKGSPRILVLDEAGARLGVRGRDQGPLVTLADLPPHVVQAFVATEDRNFYGHVGINPVAILRAVIVNARSGGIAQGGSTITQQLVKNALLTPERSIERKAQEALLALRVEREMSKDEILAAYLNTVYFGHGAYGIEAAARRYFGHGAGELTVGEAAMLAGLLKAPSRLAPTSDFEAAKERAGVVLSAMTEAGYLSASQAEAVVAEGIARLAPQPASGSYAVDAALAEARSIVGRSPQDLVIVTTIDAALTERAAAQLNEAMARDERTGGAEGAVVLMEEGGAIRVLIGGRDYARSPYDRARLAERAPGSTFKPFVFLAAIESGWRPEDTVSDTPIAVEGYAPGNYKDRYYGDVALTEAMRRSLNAPALRLQEAVGRDRVAHVARRAGLDDTDPGPSLALGVVEQTPLALARAYAALSSGRRPDPYLVSEVRTVSGDVLFSRRERAGPEVFAEADRVALDHMLRAVVREGSGVRARVPGHFAAGKTGTGQDSRDAWFAGYASGLIGVVWMGRDDFAPMTAGGRGLSGSHGPAEVWGGVMTAALEDRPARPPVPYEPEPDEGSLIDHLAGLLRWREPEETDGIAELLDGL